MLSERLNTPVSTAELERRWHLVRAAMETESIDVLVLQNDSECIGGYVRWFTDMPASMYPTTVVFPRDDAMIVVTHGPLGDERELPPDGDGILRGVKRVLSTASFPSASYMGEYDAKLVLRALIPYARATLGLVGTSQLSYATGQRLKPSLADATLVEASDLVDRIKAVKSQEEQELIRAAARLQDEAMRAAMDAVEPGKRESDIAEVVRQVAHALGSEAGVVLCGSGPLGEPAPIGPRHLQNRILRDGDLFALLIEVDGPGGMYTELGRTCTLGPVPAEVAEEFQFTLAAQRFTLDLLRPGASCRDVWEAYNAFMREHGRPEERRLHCHGQGYDLVERPFVRFDETMTLMQDMNIACHPTYAHNGFVSWICDNYLIGPNGPGERLHAFPQAIVER